MREPKAWNLVQSKLIEAVKMPFAQAMDLALSGQAVDTALMLGLLLVAYQGLEPDAR